MSVKQDGNGTWEVSAWYRDWQGNRKRKHKRGFATKREAKAWERSFLARQEGAPDMTMADFFEIYRDDRMPHLKLNTWRSKEQVIVGKILPYFGEKKLNEITPADILKWQSLLLNHRDKHGKGYSDTYLRTVSTQLSSMFNHAVRYYGLPANPVAKAGKMGSAKGGEMRFWTKDEYERFSREVMDKPLSYLAFEVLYWTGIREGELLALTPDDFDLSKGTLSVTKSYQRIDGEDVVTGPKTLKSNRVIAMPDFLTEEVADYLRLNGTSPDERMFKISKSYLYHEMERSSRAAGVKRIRVHDLRHSHVSLLIELGFNPLAIADRMGHESVDITLRYAHLFPHAQGQMQSISVLLRCQMPVPACAGADGLSAPERKGDVSMSEKLLDPQGRQRSKTISFRMSPEEADVLDSLVAASGMTKQDYITSCLIDHRITVIPHTRTYKGLYDEMGRVYRELRRIKRDGHVSADLERIIGALAEEFSGLGGEPSEVEKEDAAIRALRR